ncbi:MAG: endo alpha-1,4 polygalactosaminidase [Hyphomicrobiaceae bacterium]|nr:endo alpha-1,4 polygalactosaminidase [Hyphomicrobiaceae bacterium]
MRPLAILTLVLATLGAPALGRAQAIAPTAAPTPSAYTPSRLGGIRSWGYQLQRLDLARIEHSPYDLVVVDASRTGAEATSLTPDDVARLQRKPDGSRRVVLAYMSIGEAEDYRFYWRDAWVETISIPEAGGAAAATQTRSPTGDGAPPLRLTPLRLPKLTAPLWLGRENESWAGNFHVRFWDPDWQSIILGADGYLARLLKAGFDGVYLDRVDAFQAIATDRPAARGEMVRLVIAIAEAARKVKPGFVVVPQNGEQLLSDPAYLAVVDGIAKEDLFYGEDRDGDRNPQSSVTRSLRWLAPAVNRSLPVLVVEYVQARALVEMLKADIAGRGFIPYFGVRALDRLMLPEDDAARQPAPLLPALKPPGTSPAQKRPEANRADHRRQGGEPVR